MNRIRRIFRMVFRRDAFKLWWQGRGVLNWRKEAGEPLESSAVAAPILWFARNFPEAPPALWQKIGNGQEQQLDDHPMLRLLDRPNPFYTGPLLWRATTTDWQVNGETYWIVIPNRAGSPVQAWWTPSWMIEPKGDQGAYISHYEYNVDGELVTLGPDQVIHFRYGLDPDNPRHGMSPLKSVLREVFTDNEAADFTAHLLRNMGVPGLLVSPDGAGATISETEAQETKADLQSMFSGERRGEPLVMTGATKIQEFGFSPEQMLLRDLRRVPEERISGVLGIPAIVAGLGAGLERSTFTNMGEARESAYEEGIIPSQKLFGEDIRFQLLPLFGDDPHQWRFGFDLSKVRVLQEDLFRQARRHDVLYRAGLETRAEGRRAMGLDVTDNDDVYMHPLNAALLPADGGQAIVPAPARNGNGASNGLVAQEVAAAVVQAIEDRELTTTS